MAAPDKPDRILVQVEIEVDPEAWAREYGLDHLTSNALTADVRSYIDTVLRNVPGAWAFSTVKVTAS